MTNTIKLLNGYFLFCLMLFTTYAVNAQTTKVDELLITLKKSTTDSAQISVMKKLAVAYSSVDPEKKFYYANQYRLLAEKNGIDTLVADAYSDMGISYGIRGKMDSALYYFHQSFNKSKESNYVMGMGKSYSNIGFAYDRLDRKNDAVKNYEESLKIFRSVNYKRGISQNIINIGSLYYDLDEFKLADNYFRENLAIVKETPNNEIGLGNALFSLGNSSLKLSKLPLALDYYSKSLAIRTKIGDLSGIALSNWGLGQLYVKKNDYVKALGYLKTATNINSSLKNPFQDAVMLITTSRAYLGLNNNEMAEITAKKALIKAKESNSKGLVSLVLTLLVDVKLAQKKFADAVQIQSAYIAVRDSVAKSNNKKEVIINDLHRVNSDNKELVRDNQLIIAKNKDYTVVIAIITLLLIIVALSLIFYYIRNSEKRKSNVLLQKQKQEIADVNEELSALNEELSTQMNIISTQNIELEKLNNVKNKFFSIVSHDLRAPINNLKMLFELYHKGILDQVELNGLLVKLEDHIYTTASFLDNLLEWAKSQLEGIVVSPINVSLNEVVLENIELVNSQLKFKGLTVDSKIDHKLTAYVDPNVLNIVVRNLLSNAIKFCSKGDQITFEAKPHNGQMLLLISDTGPGISEDQQVNLFNLAYNNSMGSANEKGYQLGLVLCKDMITQSEGTINVESELGLGTMFKISLPVKN